MYGSLVKVLDTSTCSGVHMLTKRPANAMSLHESFMDVFLMMYTTIFSPICYRVYSQMKTEAILIWEEHTCQFLLGTIMILTIPFKANATVEIREWNIHSRSFRIPSSSSRAPGCCLSVYLSIWLTCHLMISGTPVLFFTIRNNVSFFIKSNCKHYLFTCTGWTPYIWNDGQCRITLGNAVFFCSICHLSSFCQFLDYPFAC